MKSELCSLFIAREGVTEESYNKIKRVYTGLDLQTESYRINTYRSQDTKKKPKEKKNRSAISVGTFFFMAVDDFYVYVLFISLRTIQTPLNTCSWSKGIITGFNKNCSEEFRIKYWAWVFNQETELSELYSPSLEPHNLLVSSEFLKKQIVLALSFFVAYFTVLHSCEFKYRLYFSLTGL